MAEQARPAKKTVPGGRAPRARSARVEGCKRPYRAKSYCFFHYKKWRQGELPHSRYRTCSKAECRDKASKGGLCEKHYAEAYKKGEAAPAA